MRRALLLCATLALIALPAAAAEPPDGASMVAADGNAFAFENGAPAFWDGRDERCDVPHSVWCVGDFPATLQEHEEEREHRRRRFGGFEP